MESREVGGGNSPSLEKVKVGSGGRISVSPAGITFLGEPSVLRESRADLRGFIFAGDFFGTSFFGDLNAPLRGDCL